MSSKTQFFSKAAIASIGVAAFLAASVSPASAGSRHGNHGWQDRKVVVHHGKKHGRKGRKVVIHRYEDRGRKVIHHYDRSPRPRVVHVYHHDPRPKRRVKVIHHHDRAPARPDFRFTKQTGGTLLGGLLGAVTGAQIGSGSGRVAAVIGGTVIGAVIGGEIGRSMDRADHLHVQRTLEDAPTGRSTVWRNPDSGAEYTVLPTRTYSARNRPCRDYEAWAFIDGYEQKITGTACRQPDGSWQKQLG